MTGAEHPDPDPDPEHRALRERLGGLVLGKLPGEQAAALRAHLDGCEDCRAELRELAPLAADLRLVDVARWPGPPRHRPISVPGSARRCGRSPDGARSLRRSAARRSRARAAAVPLLAAAAATVLTAVLLTAGRTPADPAVTGEQLRVTSASSRLTGTSAVLVPHTWGVEVKVVAGGLDDGREYHAVVRARDGRLLPAGEFLGTGAAPVRCNLQSALLRDETAGFAILDSAGRTVLDLAVPRSA